MKSRISIRKRRGAIKWLLFSTFLLMLVVAGVNFEPIPNINTYINSHDLAAPKHVKAKFSKQKVIELNTPEADNTQQFAIQVNGDAQYVAGQLHQRKLKPQEIKYAQKNAIAFSQYGYSLPQFAQLVEQYYHGERKSEKHSLNVVEKLLQLLSILITILSLLALIWYFLMPKKKIEIK